MARKGKWLKGIAPHASIVDAARLALAERLELVWHYLQQASSDAPENTVNVHQLRVGARRAVAAVRLFAELLPDRRRRWVQRHLKRVRRAAGAARDLDVMIERFSPSSADEPHSGDYADLLAHLRHRREQAQRPIEAIHHKLTRQSFTKRTRQLVKRVKLRTRQDRSAMPTFAEAARAALKPLAHKFFQAGEVDFSDDTLLHAFRIRGKQLRYAMEIFAAAFDPSFKRELYPLVADLQARLGEFNDHATAAARFCLWQREPECESLRLLLESLSQREQQHLEQCRASFIEWWTPDRRASLWHRFASFLR